ncbi:MAG TPA: O-antigen ligase family protein [Devosia sp.]|nr:O-antigen ligase family protein [Devosia sp.]
MTRSLWWLLLFSLLVAPVSFGSVGSGASLVVAMLAVFAVFPAPVRELLKQEPGLAIFLVVFFVLSLMFAINAKEPWDMRFVFNFIALPLAIPVYLLARRHAGGPWPLIIVNIALLGSFLGALFGVLNVGMSGMARASGMFNNPNMYAHIILIFGFMALPGLFLSNAQWRFIYLAGPLLGIAGTVLSGSRGTLIAIPFFVLAALLYFFRQPEGWRWAVRGAFALVLALVLGISIFSLRDFKLPRVAETFGVITQVMSTGRSEQWGTQIRIDLYKGAWRAFTESPIVGHGWANTPAKSAEQLTGRRPATGVLNKRIAAKWPHVHNDFLGFSAAAGIFGMLGYLALLAAPFTNLRRGDRFNAHRVYVAVIVVSGSAIFGLFDGMFSYDIGINSYAFTTAILAGTFVEPHPDGTAAPSA